MFLSAANARVRVQSKPGNWNFNAQADCGDRAGNDQQSAREKCKTSRVSKNNLIELIVYEAGKKKWAEKTYPEIIQLKTFALNADLFRGDIAF